jgi:hypothetical protein
MTSLREAAQQALSVLTMFNAEDSVFKGEFDQEITALRTALAESERKPLTDEELTRCFCATNTKEPLEEGWPGLERFARAIERAHGIGGEA